MSYTIRTMTRQELEVALDWAATEGWNPGLYDADCFYGADPTGFLIGLVNHVPVATVSAVKYGDTFGFIGFYIVRPESRGQGYGLQIWKAALAALEGRIIGLDGVVDQQENYRKSGFTLAYNNIRYQGMGGGEAPADSAIIPLAHIGFDELRAYDQPFFPADRQALLRTWIAQPQSTALGIMCHNQMAGYGVVRLCRSGYKVGPLYADNLALADRLFTALKAHTPAGAPLFLDVPAPNTDALELVAHHHMVAVFETARMYRGAPPPVPMGRQFGVMSFELG